MDIDQALDAFVLQLDANGRSLHTRDQYRRHVALLARWMAQERLGRDLAALGHQALARFLASADARLSARGGPKKPASLNALRSTLRAFFAYCHAAGWLRENPALLICRATCGQAPPRGLALEERQRLLDALARAHTPQEQRDAVLFQLLLGTGLRLASAVALDVGDVDLERGELEVRTVKGGWPQAVFLPHEIAELLRVHIDARTEGPLFLGSHGERLGRRQVQRRLSWWLARAGVARRASPHSLRHSLAMELYRRTGDLALVQAALGHRNIQSTLVYARCDGERLRAVMQA